MKKASNISICWGFSLLELVLTIVIAGILGAILVNFFNPLTRVGEPLKSVDNLMQVNEVMARIVADYQSRIKDGELNDMSSLNLFASSIGAEGQTKSNSYGNYYVVQNETVIDGDVEPRVLTISCNERQITYIFTVGHEN